MRLTQKSLQLGMLTLLSTTTLIACSDVALKMTTKPKVVKAKGISYLKAPSAPETGPLRYIFLVDMSYSMVQAPCATDVNNPDEPENPAPGVVISATNPGPPCGNNNGHDVDADRLSVLRQWITSQQDAVDTEFLIVPFSGGFLQTRRDRNDDKQFVGATEALSYLDQLEFEHNNDRAAASDMALADDQEYMGTSVPAPVLREANQVVYENMRELQNQNQLAQANYELFYISDGVPAPTRSHILTGLNLRSCSYDCLEGGDRCTNRCRYTLEEMWEFWGHNEDNTMVNMQIAMADFRGLFNLFGEGRLQTHLILLHPDRIAEQNKTENSNFLFSLRESFPDFRWAEINSSTPPFQITQEQSEMLSYELTDLQVLNLNTRLDSYGNIATDSDGDGLFDTDEAFLGFDPRNPRTHGVCLDILTSKPAYSERCQQPVDIIGCDPTLDIDRDGLNECEEVILSTSPYDFDTDGDSIPDSLEVTFEYNFNQDDRFLDFNLDFYNNFINFMNGLMRHHYLDDVAKSHRINVSSEFIGYQRQLLPDGRIVQVPGYEIDVKSLPSLPVLGDASTPESYFTRSHIESTRIPASQTFIGGPQYVNSNWITFLARIIEVSSPEKAEWAILKYPITVRDSNTTLKVDLSQIEYFDAIDPIHPAQ